MPYRLIVFDFDGTLADSLARAVAAFNRLAPRLGLKPVADVETARATPTRQLLRQLGIRFWRLPKVVRAFRDEVAAESAELRLHPGISDALAELAGRGYRLGVLSSNREDNIRNCLRANGAEGHFAFVVGYPKLFGKAKALRKILKTERLDRADVLFVGDELRDIEAGRRARVATAAVTWGFHAEKLLAASGAPFVLRRPADLLALTMTPDSRYAPLAMLLVEAARVAVGGPLTEAVETLADQARTADPAVVRAAGGVFAPGGTWDEAGGPPGVAGEIMRRLEDLRGV
ncbi:MAG: HAD-IA family hydrolase [Fimbriiglobus sp.]